MNTVILIFLGFICLLMLAAHIVQFLFNREIAKERRFLDNLERQEKVGKQ